MENAIDPGKVLDRRYRVLYTLGHGRFGRTYLAENLDRDNERCLLKELADIADLQLQSSRRELLTDAFQRLARLEHPQLPHFQDLLSVTLQGRERWLVVQDYIEGLTYRELLHARQQQGRSFSEAEVRDLLAQILPILIYLHEQNVIHGDICPENLMLRHQDRLPVLTDLGSLKQIICAFHAELAIATPTQNNGFSQTKVHLTRSGYAAPESDRRDELTPHDDLYALAATALVLLSGREPQYLQDPQTHEWDWSRLSLTPELQQVLQRMLAANDDDAAKTFLADLKACPPLPQPTSQATSLPAYPISFASTSIPWSQRLLSLSGKASLALLFCLTAGLMGWFAGKAWINAQVEQQSPVPSPQDFPESELEESPQTLSFPPKDDFEIEPDAELSPAERDRQFALRDRRLTLGIDADFFNELVNQVFWQRYPEQQGRALTNEDKDAFWRQKWDETANELLDRLTPLSSDARFNLGRYDATNRDRWTRQANRLHLSNRALSDLTDAAFAYALPDWQGENRDRFLDEPIGQVWQGFMFEQVRHLETGVTLHELDFPPGVTSERVSGTLQPGEGKAIVVELEANQIADIFLNADPNILISFYSPTGSSIFLEDARDRTWMGNLPESGYYEITLVSTSPQPHDYALTLSITTPLAPEF
jgi:serine/threonine-protein kinase